MQGCSRGNWTGLSAVIEHSKGGWKAGRVIWGHGGELCQKPGGVAWSQLSSSWVTVEDFEQGNMDQREILERFIQSRGWKLVAHRLNPDGMYVLSHILL